MLTLPFKVTLASASPRRFELLSKLLEDFDVEVSDVDEEAMTLADPVATAELLALEKAKAVSALRRGNLVIGADTVVALDAIQLAKPGSELEAASMLRMLSGKAHKVITGVSIIAPGVEQTFSVCTAVRFRELTEEEVLDYVRTGEPMDKAGAYAIQGGAATFVERFDGSLSNVVGLPLEALEDRLKALGST